MLLRSSVEDLASTLQSTYGVSLIVRMGDTVQEVMDLCKKATVSDLYIHEDPSYDALALLEDMRSACASSDALTLHGWSTPLRPELAEVFTALYKEYKSRASRIPVMAEVSAPSTLPGPSESQASSPSAIPSMEDLLTVIEAGMSPELIDVRSRLDSERNFGVSDQGGECKALRMLDAYFAKGEIDFASEFLEVDVDKGLEQRAIDRVLKSEQQWWQLQGAGKETEVNWAALAPGEIASRGFSELLALGCVSPRRVLEAIKDSPLSANKAALRLKDLIEWREWHRVLACRDILMDLTRSDIDCMQYRYWRHNGFLVRYAVGGLETDGPAVVLVHGFGASADQWHNQFEELSKDHKVYAVDLLGFGHAEKPAISYTQYFWEDQVKMFGKEVVREPYFVAGNSIGGYTALSAAAGTGREYVKGVVLLNSAGRMLSAEEYVSELEANGGTVKERMVGTADSAVEISEYKPIPNWLLAAGGKALFAYLQPSIKSICQNVYPDNPDAVDPRLTENIFRDSEDPGAVNVLTSGAKLPPPRTKNELFEDFGGPVLVVQGLNDPLGAGTARTRYELYGRVLSDEQLKLVGLESGHCPMHESPEPVNREMRAWIQEEMKAFV